MVVHKLISSCKLFASLSFRPVYGAQNVKRFAKKIIPSNDERRIKKNMFEVAHNKAINIKCITLFYATPSFTTGPNDAKRVRTINRNEFI